jgi:hypothetical protein
MAPVTGSETNFTLWLQEHRTDVENGSASFDGVRVTRESTVARYYCCCSLLFFYMYRQMSGCVLEGTSEASQTRLRSTLVTLLIGSLGIGIFMAPIYLFKNIAGGYRMTVGDVMDNTKRCQNALDDFSNGPAQIFIVGAAVFAIAAVALQVLIYFKHHTGQ